MLCMNNYTQEYIDKCRLRVNTQLSTYKNWVATARKQSKTNEKLLDSAIEAFEPVFFNNMALLLDSLFVHQAGLWN